MKGSPCCAGLMQSCLHTSAKYGGGVINQLWGGGISQVWGGSSAKYGGGHQPTMGGASAKYGGVINQLWGGHQPSMGGVISQVWGGHQPTMGGGIFPPVCTGSQNPENYFSNTYVLPSVNRTAGPTICILVMSIPVQLLLTASLPHSSRSLRC